MKLKKKNQLVSALEDIGGTTPSGAFTSGANVNVPTLNTSFDPDPQFIERNVERGSLSDVLGITGFVPANLSTQFELAGTALGTFAAGAPPWSKFMKACGFREVTLRSFDIGAITPDSGTVACFRHGEIVEDASANTARVVHDTWNGATEIFFEAVSGTMTAGLWTGHSTGAEATAANTIRDEGFAWVLTDSEEKTIDMGSAPAGGVFVVGDVIKGATSGAVGVVTVASDGTLTTVAYRPESGNFSDGETINVIAGTGTGAVTAATPVGETYTQQPPLSARFNEDGVYKEGTGIRANFQLALTTNQQGVATLTGQGSMTGEGDSPLLTASLDVASTPPIFRDAQVYFGDDETGYDTVGEEITSCVRGVTFDLGNQLSPRECANDPNGVEEYFISGRSGTFSIDPEATSEAFYPFLNRLRTGTPFRLRCRLGTADGNRMFITAPGCQMTAGPSGDRNGAVTRQISGKLTGGNLGNLGGASVTLDQLGGENELVISYHTS